MLTPIFADRQNTKFFVLQHITPAIQNVFDLSMLSDGSVH